MSRAPTISRCCASSRRADGPLGRVEVVPTALHWEAVYVALRFPLARGWERQLDTANNPIFYDPGRLTPRSYRAWLLDNGVRFVALSDARLDYAAYGEAYLVRRGVPGCGSSGETPTGASTRFGGRVGSSAAPAGC